MNMQRLRTIVTAGIVVILIAGTNLAGITGADDMGQPDLVAGNNAFAFDLYHAVSGDGENLILSPYSVSLALAMTYAGARGETERQMADTLHFTLPQDQLHPAFKALDESLPRDAGSGEDDESFRLNIANALWGQDGYAFLEDFLNVLNANYGAGMRLVNFGDAEAARKLINDWVSEQTEERINDLLKPGMVTPDTRLVLTNAIYFKAAWLLKFEEEATYDAPFTLLDGSQVMVPTMAQTDSFAYGQGDGYQAIALPYAGEQMAMLVVVPDTGRFAEIESALDPAQFETILDTLEGQEVHLTMPRFEYESEFSLGDTLAAMGMPDAFSASADFSGMTGARDLLISAVVHKAFVKVDEGGTEAAAATAVVMMETAMMPPGAQMHIDRPFIYAIYERSTGTILFLGRVLNPSSG
jgi:serpin B